MNNKICTSLNQSKKLIELGIDVSTSDMAYIKSYFDEGEYNLLAGPYHKGHKENDDGTSVPAFDDHIPAWSLSSLVKLLPSEFYGKNIYGDTVTYKVDFRKYKFTDDVDLYQIAYGSIKFDVDGQSSFIDMVNTGQKEDPIDAAFQMLVCLKETVCLKENNWL